MSGPHKMCEGEDVLMVSDIGLLMGQEGLINGQVMEQVFTDCL